MLPNGFVRQLRKSHQETTLPRTFLSLFCFDAASFQTGMRAVLRGLGCIQGGRYYEKFSGYSASYVLRFAIMKSFRGGTVFFLMVLRSQNISKAAERCTTQYTS